MNIQTSLKELRKQLNLNQSDFGKRLGYKQTAVGHWETGTRSIPDSAILAICREFNVNENWLRTGEGEMFVQPSAFSLDEYASAKGLADIERELIIAALEIPQEERLKFIERIRDIMKSHQPEIAAEPAQVELTIDEKVELYRKRLEAAEKGLPLSTTTEKLA